MTLVGTALRDITPPVGMAMSGFAARTGPATGHHDRLTVRAIAVEDTAVVIVDVIGISADMSARIRARCRLPDDNIIIAALHTHGGPVSMVDRLSVAADPDYLRDLEEACVTAIDAAVENQTPSWISAGLGGDPDIARNRRRPDGPVDRALPVLRAYDADGKVRAIMVAYACHPVVLGADNRLWTADYPHFVRAALERHYPGAMALFMTGCAGDLNTGHSAHASVSLEASAARSFAAAETIGATIAASSLIAAQHRFDGSVSARNCHVELTFERRERVSPQALARGWRSEREKAGPAVRALLDAWIAWAETVAPRVPVPLNERVTCLNWCGVPIVGLPGEIFAETGLFLRTQVSPETPLFVAGFADDNPGYVPPASEYAHGGYEVDEAHRYYGQPAPFAPGSAERLGEAAAALLHRKD